MNVQVPQSVSSLLPEGGLPADTNKGAEQTGDFAQLLFLMLAPQCAAVNPSPAVSTGESRECAPAAASPSAAVNPSPAVSTGESIECAPAAASPSVPVQTQEATPALALDPVDLSVLEEAPIAPTPGEKISSSNSRVESAEPQQTEDEVGVARPSIDAEAPTIELPIDLPFQKKQAVAQSNDNPLPARAGDVSAGVLERSKVPNAISEIEKPSNQESASGPQPSVSTFTVNPDPAPAPKAQSAAAKISPHFSAIEAPEIKRQIDVPEATGGVQKTPVLEKGATTQEFHGAATVASKVFASASSPGRPEPEAPKTTTTVPTVSETHTTVGVADKGDSHGQKSNLGGDDAQAWPESAERSAPPSARMSHPADGFAAVMTRREQEPGVAETFSPRQPTIDRLAGDISSHLRVGKSEAVLQLDPPELGKIKIDLRMEDGKLHARIVAEGHDSKALIESHLPELHQALTARHIDVADVRISQGSWNGASDLSQGFQQQPQGRQETGRNFETVVAQSQEPEERRPQTAPRENGRVSMWA